MTLDVAAQRVAFDAWLVGRTPGIPIEYVETHVSILAFQGDRVFKLKKAVSFPFIDLSTPEQRLRNCERELALNQRFAPDIYLAVLDVTDARGVIVDHAVEMRRLPRERRLALLVQNESGGRCVEALARTLVQLHARAPRSARIDAAGRPDAVMSMWSREVDEVRRVAGSILDRDIAEDAARLGERYLVGRTPLLNARVAAGRVCDGHGDLLADDVYCLDDGPRILDCLEFDDRLRFGDVLADAAFLAMDLERLGRHDLGAAFLRRYREQSNEDWPASLAHFYVAYRAHVRAKVACLRHSQSADDEAAAQARAHLVLARDHLRRGRVRLVLIGGSPGTGKTTLATAVGQATGWDVLHSDLIRKELAGLEPLATAAGALDSGLYSAEWNERTYRELLDRARGLLAFGHSVVLDASWSHAEWRDAAAEIARALFADLTAVQCDAPVDIAMTRVKTRPHGASDADPEVAAAIAKRFAPWPEASVIDTRRSVEESIGRALEEIEGL